ncbi:hypothetical protein [Schlesneria sp. T3-172]|uniref:hypothetical protein n=1 Tax=Schlesneria sphaerica TaxID=3373610 RepID=UPI0037CCA611
MAITLLACPFCEGTNGLNQVRDEIFSASFVPNTLVMVLPFAVFCLVLRWLYLGCPIRTAATEPSGDPATTYSEPNFSSLRETR